jgi:hypothetical protein
VIRRPDQEEAVLAELRKMSARFKTVFTPSGDEVIVAPAA